MKKTGKCIAAAGLVSIMMTGTAFAGTWEANTYSPIMPLDGLNGQYNFKTYTGFVDDRNQASLIGVNWKYQKDDGTYAVSEWVEDETGKYYINSSGITCQGYIADIDNNDYFFEPSDTHLITDSILELEYTGGWDWDIRYNVNEDGSWDFIPWEGFNLSDWQNVYFFYFDESGALVTNGAVPGGFSVDRRVHNVIKGIDENGVPYLTVGDVRYVAVKSSSFDRTYEDSVENMVQQAADHEFYTVYVRQK